MANLLRRIGVGLPINQGHSETPLLRDRSRTLMDVELELVLPGRCSH